MNPQHCGKSHASAPQRDIVDLGDVPKLPAQLADTLSPWQLLDFCEQTGGHAAAAHLRKELERIEKDGKKHPAQQTKWHKQPAPPRHLRRRRWRSIQTNSLRASCQPGGKSIARQKKSGVQHAAAARTRLTHACGRTDSPGGRHSLWTRGEGRGRLSPSSRVCMLRCHACAPAAARVWYVWVHAWPWALHLARPSICKRAGPQAGCADGRCNSLQTPIKASCKAALQARAERAKAPG